MRSCGRTDLALRARADLALRAVLAGPCGLVLTGLWSC